MWSTIKRGSPNSLNSARTSLILCWSFSIERQAGRERSSNSGSSHLQGSAPASARPAWIQHNTNPVPQWITPDLRYGTRVEWGGWRECIIGVGTKVVGWRGVEGWGWSDKALPAIAIRLDRRTRDSFLCWQTQSLWERFAICSSLHCQMLPAFSSLVVLSSLRIIYSTKAVLLSLIE